MGVSTNLVAIRQGSVAIGTVVEVIGTVTVVGTDRVVVQDGQLAGITAIVGARASQFAPGDAVSITGVFRRRFGQELLISNASDPLVRLGGGIVPEPIQLPWRTLDDPAATEALESMLVTLPPALQVAAPVARAFLPMSLRDPNNASRELIVYGLYHQPTALLGDTTRGATGILGQYNGYRPLMPRQASDLFAGDPIRDIQLGVDLAGNGGGADGDSVVVEGLVAQQEGSYGFFLSHPAGGPYSGVWVYLGSAPPAGVGPGDHVRVTGTVDEFDSFGSWAAPVTEIVPAALGVVVLSSGNPLPEPTPIAASQIADLNVAEPLEGVLVTISDPLIVVSTFNSFGEYEATTSSGDTFVIDNELIDVDVLGGQTLSAVTGYVHTTYGVAKIAPRDASDWSVGTGAAPGCDAETSQVLATLTDVNAVGDYIDARWGDPSPCSYTSSRAAIYFDLHWDNGIVEGVYTGNTIAVTPGTFPDVTVFNTEHTWPRSWGADQPPELCDLHHLFPVDAQANEERVNLYLDEVVNGITWQMGGARRGLNRYGQEVFEPRDSHKGNAARAILYYLAQYDDPLFRSVLPLYQRWHAEDPVDDAERLRNLRIVQQQGVSNPFITCPDLVDQVIP